MNLFQISASGSGKDVAYRFLSGAVAALEFSKVEPFMQF